MLVSTHVHTFFYIGETGNIIVRMNQHNYGHGSSTTCPSMYRPYSLFAYVCGFDDNKVLMNHFENMCKFRRDEEIRRGMNCMKSIASLASGILPQCQSGNDTELRLIVNFED